jgi:hypothetical protein
MNIIKKIKIKSGYKPSCIDIIMIKRAYKLGHKDNLSEVQILLWVLKKLL